MIITRRFFVTEYPIGRGLTIDVRTSPKVSNNQAQANAEALARRKLKINGVSSAQIDIFSDVKPDYSIGPKINLRTYAANNINMNPPTLCQRHKSPEPCGVCDWQPGKRKKRKTRKDALVGREVEGTNPYSNPVKVNETRKTRKPRVVLVGSQLVSADQHEAKPRTL